jgi:hypothetical protein
MRRSRRSKRNILHAGAPQKATFILAVIIYIIGIFGAFDIIHMPQPSYVTIALAVAGGLLILGVLLPDL